MVGIPTLHRLPAGQPQDKRMHVTGQTPLAGGRERPSGKPTFKSSPNRRRLYARAVVWTVWLSAGAIFVPRLLF